MCQLFDRMAVILYIWSKGISSSTVCFKLDFFWPLDIGFDDLSPKYLQF